MGSRARVALVGANGHGLWHRRHVAAREDRVELVALCDPAPIAEPADAPVPATARRFTDHREMLATVSPDIVIICTPPHTHVPIATDALRAGCDVLLEKPPVLSVAEHHALATVLAETGRAVQVGFQALGSRALAMLIEAIQAGTLGSVTGVAAVASWQRSDAYYARAAWAGRRTVDGRPTLDGALVNPLAHAVMQALVVAHAASNGTGDPAIRSVELERYRTRPIEVEDTASLRCALADGPPVAVAVSLCGEEFIPGEIIVHGTDGRAVLEYPTDRLALPGEGEPTAIPGRVSLLDNLLDHRVDRVTPLLAPLRRTLPFTTLVDAITAAPPPTPIAAEWTVEYGTAPERYLRIPGVNEALRRCGERMGLLSEQGVPWASAPYRCEL